MNAKSTLSRCQRPGVVVAGVAIAAGVSISAFGPGTADPAGTDATQPHATRSMGYTLVTADPWEPDPKPVAPPPAPAPAPAAPAPAAPPVYYPPATREYVPPPPPPPPPAQVNLRVDNPISAAIVSMANVPGGSTVGCHMTTVPLSGVAASIGYRKDDDFTLTGTQETRVPAGSANGPATGSSFRLTVTCDNGTSASIDAVY